MYAVAEGRAHGCLPLYCIRDPDETRNVVSGFCALGLDIRV